MRSSSSVCVFVLLGILAGPSIPTSYGIRLRAKTSSSEVAPATCDPKCGNGACIAGSCMCEPGWTGEACRMKTCDPPCADGEACTSEGTCESDHVRNARENAKRIDSAECAKKNGRECNGVGTCLRGVCFCKQGYTGEACSLRVCPGNPQCGGRGACFFGQCVCDRGYTGGACESSDDDVEQQLEAEKSEDDGAKILALERERVQIEKKLRDIRKQLQERVETLSADSEADGEEQENAASDIQKLRDDALKLADDSSRVTRSVEKIRAARKSGGNDDDANVKAAAAAAAKDASKASNAKIDRLAFELFEDDKRQEVSLALAGNRTLTDDVLSTGAFSESVDAELAAMWADIPKEYRDEYVQAARAAQVVRESTWALAKHLFQDSDEESKKDGSVEAAWQALSPATKARFFMAAQALAVGRKKADGGSSGSPAPNMGDAVQALQKSVHELAFDLFSDERFAWAERQVMSRPKDAPESRGAAFPDVQHLLAKTYKSVSPEQRARYEARAEQLLSSSYFLRDAPARSGAGSSESGSDDGGDALSSEDISGSAPPPFRTMIAFTIQFLGMKEMEADRKLLGAIDQQVDAMIRANTKRKVRIVQREDVATVNPNGALRRRYVLSLSNANRRLVQKTIATVKAGVEQNDLKQRLAASDGLDVTPMFVLGARPQLLAKDGDSSWTCSGEKDCSFRGQCEEGSCNCRVEVDRDGHLQEYTGYDCSFGPSLVCPKDCSFHGTCNPDGTCACANGYEGAACEIASCPNECSEHGKCFEGVCACEPGWDGDDCGTKALKLACVGGCSGHGECTETGACDCSGYWAGEECERFELPCDKPCANGGTCNNGTCACAGAWKGDACGVPTCLDGCSGHGDCLDDETPEARCDCKSGWVGNACKCPASDKGEVCSGHGMCNDGKCFCNPWFGGDRCGVKICKRPDCSGHGSCSADGVCECVEGWRGEGCGVKSCADPKCSGHGECDGSVCECDAGWIGESCEASSKACVDDCNAEDGRGKCVAVAGEAPLAVCVCKDGYGGSGCEFKACESKCSGHGLCRLKAEDDKLSGSCLCDQGWFGQECDVWGCDPSDDDTCSGHGHCETEGSLRDGDDAVHTCRCMDDWAGPRCEFQAGLEACAVCCMGETLKTCHDEVANTGDAGIMECYHSHKSDCLSRCQKGTDEKCPGQKEEYDTLITAYRGAIADSTPPKRL